MLLYLTLDNRRLDMLFFLHFQLLRRWSVHCPGRSVPKKWRPSKYKYNFQLWGNTIGSLNQEGGVCEEWHWHSANRRNPRHVCWYKLICLVQLVLIYGITVGRRATDLQPGWKISMKTQQLLSPDMLSCLCKVSQHGNRLLIYRKHSFAKSEILYSVHSCLVSHWFAAALNCSNQSNETIIYNLGCVSYLKYIFCPNLNRFFSFSYLLFFSLKTFTHRSSSVLWFGSFDLWGHLTNAFQISFSWLFWV